MGTRPPVCAVRSCSGCAATAMAKGGIATVLTVLAAATLPRLEHPAKNDGSLSLLIVGGWGHKGECNQFQVAEQVTSMFISLGLRPPPVYDPFLFVGVEMCGQQIRRDREPGIQGIRWLFSYC